MRPVESGARRHSAAACTFVRAVRNQTGFHASRARLDFPGNADVPSKNYLLRQVATVMKFAKETNDPEIAARLLAKAASLNEKLDEISLLKMDVSPQAPDVEV